MKDKYYNVLIACEYSGRVRRAFAERGHYVTSCDLLPADDGVGETWQATASKHWGIGRNARLTQGVHRHLQRDVLDVLYDTSYQDGKYDLMIGFPPCTHLSASGARWWPAKRQDGRQQQAIEFFMSLADANVPQIALENPIGYMSTVYRKPDCIVQPWQHGHGETKATCLWLKNLPTLQPTNIVEGREPRMWKLPPSANRWKLRSETYAGIANAMADQWG